MDEIIRVKVESDFAKFEREAAKGAKAVDGFGQATERAAAAQKRASQSMNAAHSEALRMNATTGRLATSVGFASNALAQFGTAAGVPVGPLRALAAAEDVVTLGFGAMSKSATGLTAVMGPAAVAIAAVAGAVKLIGPAFDEAVAAGENLPLEVQAVVNMAKEAAKVQAAVAATRNEIADRFASRDFVENIAKWRGVVDEHLKAGTSSEEIRELYGDKLPESIDKWLKATERAAAGHKKAVDEAKRGLTELLNFQDKVTGFAESAIGNMFGAQSAAFMASGTDMSSSIPATLLTPMRRGPDLSRVMSGVASGAITPGVPRDAGVGFGKTFEEGFQEAIKDLPGVVLAAFQGGGNVGKSIGASLGGSLSQSLATAAGPALGKMFGKTVGGAIGSAIPVVGTLLGGAIGGLFGGLFGGGKSKEQKEAERKQAEEMRARIQGMAAASRAQSIDALGGAASAFFAGNSIVTEEDAKRSGTLFIDAWTQVVKTKGVLAAADAFGGAFDKMKADIEKQGIAMPDWMRFVEGQMGLSKNEGFRAAATGSQNAASFLGALGGSGGLSPESFRAFEQEARAQFAAAEGAAAEAGQSSADATKAGFAATNPLLKGLLNESMVTGQTLSADIQKLIEQAGIVPDVDIQQLGELRQIRAAVQAMAGSGGGALPGPAAGGPGGRADFGGEDRYPAFASGGNVTRTGLALVHKGEEIIRASDVGKGATVNANITIQASGNEATDKLLAKRTAVELGKLIRGGGGRQFVSALADDGFARRGRH